MTEHSPEYEEYMTSQKWYNKRKLVISRAGGACEQCGASGISLEVHHLTYENFMNEDLDELQALCQPCHRKADKKRQKAMAKYHRERRWYARVNGWASRGFGENWDQIYDFDEMERRFKIWLSKRGGS